MKTIYPKARNHAKKRRDGMGWGKDLHMLGGSTYLGQPEWLRLRPYLGGQLFLPLSVI
jgi:hypothetical protein